MSVATHLSDKHHNWLFGGDTPVGMADDASLAEAETSAALRFYNDSFKVSRLLLSINHYTSCSDPLLAMDSAQDPSKSAL